MNTNHLIAYLWNAPFKPYHLKPVNAMHYSIRQGDGTFAKLPPKQQKRNIFICPKCAGLVAFADSKTGTQFVCDVKPIRSRRDWNFYYYPNLWHSKSCQPTADGEMHEKAWMYQRDIEILKAEQQKKEASK